MRKRLYIVCYLKKSMKKVIWILVFLLFVSSANSELVQEEFLIDHEVPGMGLLIPRSMAKDDYGNFYLAIQAEYAGQSSVGDAFLMKLDFDGNILWNKSFSIQPVTTQGVSVVLDSLDNIYVTSPYLDGVQSRPLILKYDSNGNLLFNRTGAPGHYYGKIVIDNSDNIYVLVDQNSVSKINTQGVEVSNFTLPTTIYALSTDDSGNLFFAGSGSLNEAFLIKYDASFNHLWNASYSRGYSDDSFSDLTTDSSGNIYAVGYTYNGANYDVIVQKYNSSGGMLLNLTIDSGGEDDSQVISTDSLNNVYIMASPYDDDGNMNIIKFNTTGSEVWQHQDSNFNQISGMLFDDQNNLFFSSYRNGGNLSFVKYLLANSIQGTNNSVTTIGLESLDVSLDGSSDLSGDHTGIKELEFKDGSDNLLNWTHNFGKGEIDLSQISIEKSSGKIAFNLGDQIKPGDVRTFYFQSSSDNIFYCPTAKTLAQVTNGCSGALYFSSFPSTQHTSDGSYVTASVAGSTYKIVTNSTVDDGGGEGSSTNVPEFNLTTMILVIITTLFGISILRRK